MRVGDVHDGEEGLITALIPTLATPIGVDDIPRAFRWRPVVIGFRMVGCVITGFAEILGESADERRRASAGAHMMRADSRRVHTGDQRRAGRSTGAPVGVGVRVDNAFPCEAVDVRRDGVGISIDSQLGADVFQDDPQDVGSFRGGEGKAAQVERGEEGTANSQGHDWLHRNGLKRRLNRMCSTEPRTKGCAEFLSSGVSGQGFGPRRIWPHFSAEALSKTVLD